MKESSKRYKRRYSSSSASSSESRSSSQKSSPKRKQKMQKKGKEERAHKHHRRYSNERQTKKERKSSKERRSSNDKERRNERYSSKKTQNYQSRHSTVKREEEYGIKQKKQIEWRGKKDQQSYGEATQKVQQYKNEPVRSKQQQQEKVPKEQPCFQPSGILLQYYNSREGVSLKFHQPPEAREPIEEWRMYIFKGEEVLQPIILTKSNYLIGKDQRIVDILAENPSISRQHCVIQFRLIQKRTITGQFNQAVKPYVMDLESKNGTFLNEERVESGRYYQLLHKDVLKLGFSDRQYVIVKMGDDNQQGNQDYQE